MESSCVWRYANARHGKFQIQLRQDKNSSREVIPNARNVKTELAKYVAQKAGLNNFQTSNPRGMSHFGVWQFRLRNKKEHPKT
jgi:hypothetical protein